MPSRPSSPFGSTTGRREDRRSPRVGAGVRGVGRSLAWSTVERLTDTPELMDGPLDERLLRDNLRDLIRVNRYLGGIRLSTKAVERLLSHTTTDAQVSLLDIGTGAGDIPMALIDRLAEHGRIVTVHAIDAREEMIAFAQQRAGDRTDVTFGVCAVGDRLPFADRSFDIVHCSLVLHHLEPDKATRLVSEAARVSRIGIVVNDLDRAQHLWMGAWLLGHLLTGNRYTRHDGPLSVRRAYRPAEVTAMAAASGVKCLGYLGGLLGHRYALAFAAPAVLVVAPGWDPMSEAEVAIVGGGPAGAALAIRLARSGVDVALFERQPEPRWRACGVYSSPLTHAGLAVLGLTPAELNALIRPIDAMEVVSLRGPVVRLTHAAPYACGLDRVRLERCLLDRARAAGARVSEGATVRDLVPGRHATEFRVSAADGLATWRAGIVVGADGPSSMVARAFGVARSAVGRRRAGLTVHRADVAERPVTAGPDGAITWAPASARMYLGRGWYCGIAPVPGGRVNIGLVMDERELRKHLASGGRPAAVVHEMLGQLPTPADHWRDAPDTDDTRVALPLAHRVARPAGPGFLLVGDAAGFLDPLSGEGIHRALVSAELAADAIVRALRGDPDPFGRYARRMRSRFAPKDLVSWLLQLFLSRPELADLALRHMATRDTIRATFGRVLVDELPASRVLDPRFLGGLLRP